MAGEQASSSTQSVAEELTPEIGLLGALAIGVGTMIAAGIFVLSGLAVGKGGIAILSFIIAAIIAGVTAATYAEFSSVYRESGGGYLSAYVIDPDASEGGDDQTRSLLATASETFESGGAFETKLLESDDVVTALVEESADHDLTIFGATREGAFQRVLFGAIPETVATRAATTVIMAKRNHDVMSRLRQSFDKLRERATGRSSTMEQDQAEQAP